MKQRGDRKIFPSVKPTNVLSASALCNSVCKVKDSLVKRKGGGSSPGGVFSPKIALNSFYRVFWERKVCNYLDDIFPGSKSTLLYLIHTIILCKIP